MWGGPVFAEILKRKYLLKADTELQNSENLLKKKKKKEYQRQRQHLSRIADLMTDCLKPVCSWFEDDTKVTRH